MKLTVLGCYGPFPAPGGACSGYLFESGDVALALDLGNGTLSNLFKLKPNLDLSAVLLSHLHSDHMADMLVLRYALQQLYAHKRPVPYPLTVVAPEEPEVEYRQLASSGVYDMVPAQDGMRLRFGDLSIRLHRTVHPVPTYCFRIEQKGKAFFYTGDTGDFAALERYARGANVILADTCFINAEKAGEGVAAHLTAGEAGLLAKRAKAEQLICTHLWGGADQSAQLLEEARVNFPNVLIAKQMHEYQL
jgi:ribonuclease BN (tRNA processing enzyme)